MNRITRCRSCDSYALTNMLDLGEQYISDFRQDASKPNKYPLEAVICTDCMLVQLKHTTPPQEMYHENYGFKSGVSNGIKADLKDIVQHAQSFKQSPKSWLDIASNDGTLLSYVPKEVYRVGVDPVGFLCEEAKQHADWIINDFFTADRFTGGKKFDVVTSISCFYDMPDPNTFVSDVKKVLSQDGVWIIQQNYLLSTLQLGALDNFCHEHLEYYTLLSLEHLLDRNDLSVIHVSTSMVNGGSIRTVVAHKGVYPEDGSVHNQRRVERRAELGTMEPYLRFPVEAYQQTFALGELLKKLKEDKKVVYVLAASTRGATIWQAAGITKRECQKAVERNTEKVGKYFSALGIPIISEEQARNEKPDYMLVGPWFFRDEIIEREKEYLQSGGHLIFPLPKLEVV